MCIPSVRVLNFHFVLLRQTLLRKRKVFKKLKFYRNMNVHNY